MEQGRKKERKRVERIKKECVDYGVGEMKGMRKEAFYFLTGSSSAIKLFYPFSPISQPVNGLSLINTHRQSHKTNCTFLTSMRVLTSCR